MQATTQIHSLQYLRSFAALLVVYSHAVQQHGGYAKWLPYYGDLGVDIFFVISGFILVWIAKDFDTPKQFLMRRICRVVPLYWFFTLLIPVIFIVLPDIVRRDELAVVDVVKSLLFIPHWSSTFPGELWPLLVPGWSLNYEMYFYCIFALSLWLPARWRILFTSALIFAGFAAANLAPTNSENPSALQEFMKQSVVLEFIFGMLLALWFRRFATPSKMIGYLLIIAAVVILILQPMLYSQVIPRILQFGIPALAIVAGALIIGPGKNNLGLALGDSSYALYLSHGLVLAVLRAVMPENEAGGWQAAWFYLVVALLVSAIVGYAVHRILDNWLIRRERLAFIFNWFEPKKSAI